jgi:hypothetical protein
MHPINHLPRKGDPAFIQVCIHGSYLPAAPSATGSNETKKDRTSYLASGVCCVCVIAAGKVGQDKGKENDDKVQVLSAASTVCRCAR